MIPNEVLDAVRQVQKTSADPDTLQAHTKLLSMNGGTKDDVNTMQDLTESHLRIEAYKAELKELTAATKDLIKGERDLIKSLRRRTIGDGQQVLDLGPPSGFEDMTDGNVTTIKIPAGSAGILRKAAQKLRGEGGDD
jgi:hypothetical protein